MASPLSRPRIAGLLVVVIALAAGCAGTTPALTPSASVTTAIQGWERWLRLDWTVDPGGQALDGYVESHYGSPISDVRLLAQGFDGAGNVVGQQMAWVPGIVPSLQRTYFRIGSMPAATQYRVTVWAFEVVQSHSYE